VVVCSRLFDQLWEDVFAYSQTGAYWPEKEKFMRYLFMGWIRPDKLPSGEFVDKWWDFFRALTASGKFGDYKVAGAIYKSWFFLESYQSVCVENCIRNGI
jgi:hypothetical protein